MKASIHIAEAIGCGNRIIHRPAAAIAFGCTALGFLITQLFHVPPETIAAGMIGGILLSSLYKKIARPYWKVWAFTAVDDIHALREKAIRADLIGKGKLAGGFEFRTADQTQRLREIDTQLAQPRPHRFFDDETLPDRIVIRHSKPRSYLQMAGSLAVGGMGLYLAFQNEHFYGYPMIIYSALNILEDFDSIIENQPQIALDSYGITITGKGSWPWLHIRNERVESEAPEYPGSKKHQYLVYSVHSPEQSEQRSNTKEEKIRIDNFDMAPVELEHLLTVYRGRSEQQTQTT